MNSTEIRSYKNFEKYGTKITDKQVKSTFYSLIHKKKWLEARIIVKNLVELQPDNKDFKELLILLNIKIEN